MEIVSYTNTEVTTQGFQLPMVGAVHISHVTLCSGPQPIHKNLQQFFTLPGKSCKLFVVNITLTVHVRYDVKTLNWI